jgi:hypothetical protein
MALILGLRAIATRVRKLRPPPCAFTTVVITYTITQVTHTTLPTLLFRAEIKLAFWVQNCFQTFPALDNKVAEFPAIRHGCISLQSSS